MEGEREPGLDQKRYANQPAREKGWTERALDVGQAQLSDRESRVVSQIIPIRGVLHLTSGRAFSARANFCQNFCPSQLTGADLG